MKKGLILGGMADVVFEGKELKVTDAVAVALVCFSIYLHTSGGKKNDGKKNPENSGTTFFSRIY